MENFVIDLSKNFDLFFEKLKKPALLLNNQNQIIKINSIAKSYLKFNEGDIFPLINLAQSKESNTLKIDSLEFKSERIDLSDGAFILILDTPSENFNLLKTIISNSPLGIIIFDKSGKPIYYNNTFEEMWGIKQDLIKNYNLFTDERLQTMGVLSQILKIFEEKQTLFFEGYYDSLLEQGKGYSIWVESTVLPVLNDKNEVEFIVIIHKDNSDIKLAEEEIRIAKTRADEANRLKDAFLQNLSHEIRTPINAIIGFGEILAELVKEKIDENDYNLLENFIAGIKRLHRTLTQILEISQIDTGNYQINIEPLSLRDEIEKVIKELKSEIERKNLDLIINIDDEYNMILADKPALNRILTNLLENAIKFTNKGYIKIETYPSYNKTLLFCSIKDTGIGINEKYLDHIFEPFSQEEHGYNRPYEGSGLGLALTKRYLDLINSSITVDSVKGVGSTFTFTLPIYKN